MLTCQVPGHVGRYAVALLCLRHHLILYVFHSHLVVEYAATRENTERPHAPGGIAAVMSAHSKTPYITPSMKSSSGKGVVRGRGGQRLEYAASRGHLQNVIIHAYVSCTSSSMHTSHARHHPCIQHSAYFFTDMDSKPDTYGVCFFTGTW